MEQTMIISLAALAIDFLVCFAFGIRLLYLLEKKKLGKFVKQFMYLFLLFALFILLTPFYLPNVVTSNPDILKTAFLLDFGILMAISVLILTIVLDGLKREGEFILPAWSMASALVWLYLLFTINPINESAIIWGFWGFTPITLIIAAFMVCAPIIFASGLFLKKAIQEKEGRAKFFLLSSGFFLVVFGGPLHQFGNRGNIFLLADFVTTLGFVLLFFAILIREKQKV